MTSTPPDDLAKLAERLEKLSAVMLTTPLSMNSSGLLKEAATTIRSLTEKVEILEAEIRVMRKLPGAVNAAVDRVIEQVAASAASLSGEQ